MFDLLSSAKYPEISAGELKNKPLPGERGELGENPHEH